MTGSFEKINYRLRPAKHAERFMLCDVFRRLAFAPIETYQYVGFGSVSFVDFRLYHRALGIMDMTSIELGGDEAVEERFQKNVPFSGISMRFGHSSEVLPTIDFDKPSIVWLDYDDRLTRSMAADLGSVARTIKSGSFVGVTFAAPFPTDKSQREAEMGRLKGDFPESLGDDADPKMMLKDGLAKFGRSALGNLLSQALRDADVGKDQADQRQAEQVCFFRYADGMQMVTVGWVIVANRDVETLARCRFSDLPFVRNNDAAFQITVPMVTATEVREMERLLPGSADDMTLEWIPIEARRAFVSLYRYLPHYANFEPS